MRTNKSLSTQVYEAPSVDVRALFEAVRICADSLGNNEPFIPKPGGPFDF